MPVNPVNFRWIDEHGAMATHGHTVDDNVSTTAALDALRAALNAISHAKINKVDILRDVVSADAIADGPYSVCDKAVFLFEDVNGNPVQIVIPAPAEGILQADDEKVLESDDAVQDLITAILTYAVSKGADALVRYIKGWRSRRNRKA